MKKVTKRLLLLAVMVILCVTVAVSASAETEGGYTYIVTDGKATITHADSSVSGDVVIPGTLGGYPVTVIGNDAFRSCYALTSVTIPEGVTTIGNSAFSSCYALTSVTIPEGVTTIGNYAFSNCSALTSVTIPDSVTTIGNFAFNSCSTLTSVTIPEGVTTIGNSAFSSCQKLTSVTIPASVTSLGKSAFGYCYNLKQLIVDENNPAYSADEKGILFNKDKTVLIAYNIGCKDKSYTVPDSVEIISAGAFYDCTALRKVIIGDGVTTIGDDAFHRCDNLTDVVLGKNVRCFGTNVFCNSPQVKLTVDEENEYITSVGSVLFSKDKTELILYIQKEMFAEYVIPEGVTKIGDNAFSGVSYLAGVTIPEGVTEIGDYAFYGCNMLLEVDFPSSLRKIGEGAFSRCDYLLNITVPDTVTSIGEGAFGATTVVYCNKNSSAHNYFVSNGENMYVLLDGTDEESIISGEAGNIIWTLDKRTGVLEISGTGDMPYFTDEDFPWAGESYYVTSLVIKEGITGISDGAFERFYYLREITIPSSVTRIGHYAFRDSSLNLEKVHITDLAKWCSIDFEGQESTPFAGFGEMSLLFNSAGLYLDNELITDLKIPEGTTEISDYSFMSNSNIKSVSIPSSLESIGSKAFYWSFYIDGFTVDSNNPYFSSDGDGVLFNKDKSTLIKYPYALPCSIIDVFLEGDLEKAIPCLIEYTVPDTVKVIEDYAFAQAVGLYYVELPDGLTDIGNYAFENTSVYSLSVPGTVTRVGDEAVYITDTLEFREGTKTIGGDGIQWSYLELMIIPESVTVIKEGTFMSEWDASEKIYYAGTEEQWNNIIVEENNDYLADAEVIFNYFCASHKYTKTEIADEADCGDIGLVKHICDCGWWISKPYADLDNHLMTEWEIEASATCTSEGAKSRYCESGCGKFEEAIIEKIPHPYETVVTEPTCTAGGYTTYTCGSCGDSYVGDRTAKKGHSYSSAVTPPTCTKQGYTTYTCSGCGDSYVRDYVSSAHSYSSVVSRPATHLSEGIRTYTCGNCGDSYDEVLPKTATHGYVASSVVSPSCESQGYTVYVCECGHSYNGDIKAATDHNYNGNTCTVCGESKSADCSCNCHKGGIQGLIWKILNFFYKLFKANPVCACGVAHY